MSKITQRRRRIAMWAVWGAVAALAIGLLVAVTIAVIRLGNENDRLADRVAESRSDRADLRHLVEQQGAALGDANSKLIELGQAPVEQPEIPPPPTSPLQGAQGPQGPSGPPGPRGLSCVEELGYPKCRGDQGETGTAGTTGAQGQQGDQGPAGKDGTDGKDGAQGPQGEPGPAGPPGPAGTAQPGTYSCPAGEVMTGFTVAADGSVSLACQPTIPAAQGGKQ